MILEENMNFETSYRRQAHPYNKTFKFGIYTYFNYKGFYINYKGFYNIISFFKLIVNANREFIMIDVGINDRISDGGVFFYSKFEELF